MSKSLNLILGAIFGWFSLWLVFTLLSYAFYLNNVSFLFWSPLGMLVNILVVIISTLPFWFLRHKNPSLAKGIIWGIILTGLVFLVLSFFSI